VLIHHQDFIPRLKRHILPRIQAMSVQEVSVTHDSHSNPLSNIGLANNHSSEDDGSDSLFFKNDRMYHHNLIKVNYMTYDVRRAQDVINPNTPHCNIMLLACPDDLEANANHPFLYARVLGIFHVNVVYAGPGMLNYVPRRVYFLWVWWFQYFGRTSVTWHNYGLDSLCYPPMASDGAFGFVDPRDVLRGFHPIPNFAKGMVHLDGIGLSGCAADSYDWCQYYVGR
jgi:hypothetical protein